MQSNQNAGMIMLVWVLVMIGVAGLIVGYIVLSTSGS